LVLNPKNRMPQRIVLLCSARFSPYSNQSTSVLKLQPEGQTLRKLTIAEYHKLVDASFTVIAPWAPLVPTNARVAFQSVNYPDRSIRHRDFLGYVEPINATSGAVDKDDATFLVVPGLNPRAPGCISFASVNFPDYYLRHKDFRIRLDHYDGSELFQSDATFCPHEGLAGAAISFTPSNYPSRWLRHNRQNNFALEVVQSDGGPQFHQDASFKVLAPWAP
jgi:hypothetical protein